MMQYKEFNETRFSVYSPARKQICFYYLSAHIYVNKQDVNKPTTKICLALKIVRTFLVLFYYFLYAKDLEQGQYILSNESMKNMEIRKCK